MNTRTGLSEKSHNLSNNTGPTTNQAPPQDWHLQLTPRILLLQILRRIQNHDRLKILLRDDQTRRDLQFIPTLQIPAHLIHILQKLRVGSQLADGIPLVLLLVIAAAEIVTLARRDEIEPRRTVRAVAAVVGTPDETGWVAFAVVGVAGGLEFFHACRERRKGRC